MNATFIISSDYYMPIPDTVPFSSQEVVEGGTSLLTNISEDILPMIRENPKAILLGVTGIGVCLILTYGMTGALQQMAYDKYKGLKKKAKDQLIKTGRDLSLRDQLIMASLAPFAKGLPKYFSCGKWYMVTAAILLYAGHYFGYPKLGGVGVGVTLAAGHFSQMAAENKRQHEKTQKKIDAVKAEVVLLSKQLDGAQKEITQEIQKETAKVSAEVKLVGSDVKGVDNKIETLSAELKDVPNTILSLVDRVQGIEAQNETILKQTRGLSEQLEEAVKKFVSTKEQFDSLAGQITQKMVDLAQETTEQIKSIDLKTAVYNEHTEQQINKLLDDAKAKNEVLESFQRVQKENGKQLINLDIKLKELSAKDALKLKSLEQIISAHEKSTTDFGKHVTEVNKAHAVVQSSLNSVFDQMHAVNQRITAIEEKTDTMQITIQANHEELLRKTQENYKILLEKYKKEKKRTKELQQTLQDSRSENSENMVTLRRDLGVAIEQMYNKLGIIQGQNAATHDILLGQQFINPSCEQPASSMLITSNPRNFSIDPILKSKKKSKDQLYSKNSQPGLVFSILSQRSGETLPKIEAPAVAFTKKQTKNSKSLFQ